MLPWGESDQKTSEKEMWVELELKEKYLPELPGKTKRFRVSKSGQPKGNLSPSATIRNQRGTSSTERDKKLP